MCHKIDDSSWIAFITFFGKKEKGTKTRQMLFINRFDYSNKYFLKKYFIKQCIFSCRESKFKSVFYRPDVGYSWQTP